MNPEVLEYISAYEICVLAVEMPDGSPHAATVHYAPSGDEPTFVFMTHPKSRKGEAIVGKESVRVTLVIGFKEDNVQRTFQADGIVRLLKDDETVLKEAYLTRFPGKDQKFKEDIFFKFTPTWWRLTTWSEGNKTILTS